MKRIMLVLLTGLGGTVVLLALFLLIFQDRLIYQPNHYIDHWDRDLGPDIEVLRFTTGQGAQVAFYIPPRVEAEEVPPTLWVYFNGNASQSLDWEDEVFHAPRDHAGALLIEYPGYGACEGRPSPRTIRESMDGAMSALAKHLRTDVRTLSERSNVIGHSLGAANALVFATRYPVRKVILIAPFTSMADMAARVVGSIPALMLVHRFDNRARLNELARRPSPPKVLIIHGGSDDIIPNAMGHELANAHAAFATCVEVRGGTHDSVIYGARKTWYDFMEKGTK